MMRLGPSCFFWVNSRQISTGCQVKLSKDGILHFQSSMAFLSFQTTGTQNQSMSLETWNSRIPGCFIPWWCQMISHHTRWLKGIRTTANLLWTLRPKNTMAWFNGTVPCWSLLLESYSDNNMVTCAWPDNCAACGSQTLQKTNSL